MNEINIKVVTTDKDIAIKFYNKIIGLHLKKETGKITLMKCNNCNVEIRELIKKNVIGE